MQPEQIKDTETYWCVRSCHTVLYRTHAVPVRTSSSGVSLHQHYVHMTSQQRPKRRDSTT